jgi:hypothetical protein
LQCSEIKQQNSRFPASRQFFRARVNHSATTSAPPPLDERARRPALGKTDAAAGKTYFPLPRSGLI